VSTQYWVKGRVRAADVVDGRLVTQDASQLVGRLKAVDSYLELISATDDSGPITRIACQRARRRDALRGRPSRKRVYRPVGGGRRRATPLRHSQPKMSTGVIK
jgi:hypothetical protein